MRQMRNAVHLDFDGNGDLLLDFLGGAAGPLRDDLHPDVGDIRIGFDGQRFEGNDAPDEKQHGEAQDHEAVVEGEIDERCGSLLLQGVLKLQRITDDLLAGRDPEINSCMLFGRLSPLLLPRAGICCRRLDT